MRSLLICMVPLALLIGCVAGASPASVDPCLLACGGRFGLVIIRAE